MTQLSEFATQLGRSPDWWLLAARKAMLSHRQVWFGSRDDEDRDLIRAEAGRILAHRLDHLLDIAEHSSSGGQQ